MKVRMIVNKLGYEAPDTEVNVSEDRAARWCNVMRIAEFVEKKDAKAIDVKTAAMKKAAEAEAKRLLKRQQKIDKGEGIED